MYSVWWLRPHILALFVHVPIVMVASILSYDWYYRVANEPKIIDSYSCLFAVACFLGYAFFAYFGGRHFYKLEVGSSKIRYFVLGDEFRRIVGVLLLIYLTANIILFAEFIRNPSYFLLIASTDVEQGFGKEIASSIPGITTLTQTGVVLGALLGCKFVISGNVMERRYWKYVFILFFFALLRAYLRGERLAVIEISVAFLVPILLGGKISRKTLMLLPLVGIPSVVIMFGFFEYFRSWMYYYVNIYDSYLQFVFDRFASYFMMAQNSGAAYKEYIYINDFPWMTSQWLFKFPGMTGLNNLYDGLYTSYMTFLWFRLNPEFNNIPPVFALACDYGYVGAVFLMCFLGFVSGVLYKQFVHMYGVGMLLYPSWFIGVLELSRTFTWGGSRFFPVLLFTILICLYATVRYRMREC